MVYHYIYTKCESMEKNSAEEGWWRLIELCAGLNDKKLVNELFDLFLTLEEKEALATRCLLVGELLKGKKTQREIAAQLQISISKITRGSNALKTINKELREYLSERL